MNHLNIGMFEIEEVSQYMCRFFHYSSVLCGNVMQTDIIGSYKGVGSILIQYTTLLQTTLAFKLHDYISSVV